MFSWIKGFFNKEPKEMQEEDIKKDEQPVDKAYDPHHNPFSSNYILKGIQAPIAVAAEQWTEEDQKELDRHNADHNNKIEEEKQKKFMSYPEHLREDILEIAKKNAVEQAFHEMDSIYVPTSPAHDLITAKFNRTCGWSTLSVRNDTTWLDTYENLLKLHAEQSTREIIMKDDQNS